MAQTDSLAGFDGWHPYQDGASIGLEGSEHGVILADSEHEEGARVTLEQVDDRYYTLTMGVYGLMVHTAFLSPELSAAEAEESQRRMCREVSSELLGDDPEIEAFIARW